jgi:hypothetical protein
MSSKQNLKKTLLATTCLTALSFGSAQAAVINENSIPGGDFSGVFATPTALPIGTTEVIGEVGVATGDILDVFSVGGFTAGSLVNVSMSSGPGNQFLQVFTSLDPDSAVTPVFDSEGSPAILVGSSGTLYFSQSGRNTPGSYEITISAPPANVPIAPTAALIGAGIAAVGLRRRKHGAKK